MTATTAPPPAPPSAHVRPPLTSRLGATELRRWYWTTAELIVLARTLGVPTGGGRAALAARLTAALDAGPPGSPRVAGPSRRGRRRPAGRLHTLRSG